jgi:hypothetical protein
MKLSRGDNTLTFLQIGHVVCSLPSWMTVLAPHMYISLTAPLPTPVQQVPIDPCVPSPCGINSQCQNNGGTPACSCLPTFIGMPPNCRPECVIHSECPSNQACIRERCRGPCPGACGTGAQCHVLNHLPICTCQEGYSGDPFTSCFPQQPQCKTIVFI